VRKKRYLARGPILTEAERKRSCFRSAVWKAAPAPLLLADADGGSATLGLAGLYQELTEKMRFSRAATSICALVTGRVQQRFKDFSRRNFQDGQ
jgi:hypothetical protein